MSDVNEPNEQGVDELLEVADPSKRELMKRLVTGAAFALPVVASFAVADMAAALPGSFVTVITTTPFS